MPIGDYFTMTSDSGEISYRPTCHNAYYPADDAVRSWHELLGHPAQPQRRRGPLHHLAAVDGTLAVVPAGHRPDDRWRFRNVLVQ
jgi:homospermidine synthase